jgi:hypothetical protein
MLMQISKKDPNDIKNKSQSDILTFFKIKENCIETTVDASNSALLGDALKRESLKPTTNSVFKEENGNSSVNGLELLSNFKVDFEPEIIEKYWKWMRKGDKFDPNNFMIRNGFIIDYSQHAAIILSERGLDYLNLRVIYSQRESELFQYSAFNLRRRLTKAKQKDNAIFFSGVKYSAEILEFLVNNLKETRSSLEEGSNSIAVAKPIESDDGQWPLIVRNDVTLILGVLAP